MYPLVSEYEEPIINFINGIKQHEGVDVFTNAMSTYLQGEFKTVWTALGDEFGKTFASNIPLSNVIKIIPRRLPISDGWLTF